VVTAGVEASRRESAFRLTAGVFAGFALLAAVNAIAIAVAVPIPSGGAARRMAHHVFDAAETLGVGAILATGVGAFVRLTPLPLWALAGGALVASAALVHRILGDYLTIQAARALDGRFETAIFVASVALLAVVLDVGPFVASVCSRRPGLRFLPLLVAASALVINQILLRDDYMDVHGYTALAAALLGGMALAPRVEKAGRALSESYAGRAALAALGLFALFGVTVLPSNATRFELFRQPSAIASWALATTVWSSPRLHAPVAPLSSPWVLDRSSAPAVPPTTPPLLPPDAVVVLVTVDAVRADIVADAANDARLPTLARLKREGIVFTHASAPGTQTAVSLGTLFSGHYYSEQLWKNHGSGNLLHLYPAEDPSPRFPQILSDHGVATVNVASLPFLAGDFGVARGFREEDIMERGPHAANGFRVVRALLERLGRQGPGSLFLCAHLVDAHAPYGSSKGSDGERYLASVVTEDALLGRVLRALENRFDRRWALFVSADHGEAFGEHQTYEHGKTLYEELLHVPLLARSPLFPPHEVRQRVGLIDLGPTILDLLQVETPATFHGQSLVRLLAGGDVTLTRPILAESRLRRSLTKEDGLKVIEDSRRKVVEVYDLASDPRETRNLFDVDPSRSDLALAELRAFFAVHARREHGYEPPYKY
jgi:hypothetical protein